jgi:general stress protein 26
MKQLTKAQLKKEIWHWFKKYQIIYLASVKGKKPQVRPVTMIYFQKKFWVMTGTDNAKTKQITKNHNVQYCLMIKRGTHHGYIRADCRARIVKDRTTKHLLADSVSFFKNYWKSADEPSYTLLELLPRQIEYQRPSWLYAQTISI